VKELVIIAIAILVPMDLLAQRGGGRGMVRGPGVPGNFGFRPSTPAIPPLRVYVPIAPNLGGPGPSFNNFNNHGSRFPDRYPARYGGYPFYGWGGYLGCGYGGCQESFGEAGNQSTPNGVMPAVYQDRPVSSPLPPAEIREYHWPNDPPKKPGAAFSIFSTDGTIYRADMVCVQEDAVRFFTPEGTELELPLASLDRARTREANAGSNVKLQLPPGN
jgi:hypothetical protein